MPDPILVTGGTGALGTHLVELLQAEGHETIVWARGRTERTGRPGDLPVTTVAVDMRRASAVERGLAETRPAVIFHLVGVRAGSAREVVEANVLAFANLITGLERTGVSPLCVVAGSSAQYGLRSTARPVRESEPLRGTTLYAVTKTAQELLALAATRAGGPPVIAARVFNMIGPRQRPGLLPADVARQLRDPRRAAVAVGDLSGLRDYLDYRDAAGALVALSRRGSPGTTVNVCSGGGIALRGLIRTMIELSGRDLPIVPRAGTATPQPGPRHQVGDPSLLKETTGWRPRISIDRSIRDLLTWHETR